jgi:hypothetical protein
MAKLGLLIFVDLATLICSSTKDDEEVSVVCPPSLLLFLNQKDELLLLKGKTDWSWVEIHKNFLKQNS